MPMLISFVLPCYRPPAGWAANVVQRYHELVQYIAGDVEVILVQDGDQQKVTPADIRALQANIPLFKYISYPQNKGKGHAIRAGVAQASGEYIIYTDIDFPYTNESILAVYNACSRQNIDVAIGVKDETYYSNVSFSRRFISKILRLMIRGFFSVPVTDTQCGLKAFQKKVAPVFLGTTINRYLFDIEFIRESRRKGYSIQAIPVTLKGGVQFTNVNYKILIPELVNFIRLMFK